MLAIADQNVADASAAASAAQASLDAARSRAARLTSSLPGYNTIMRSESQLVRSIEDGRNSVQMLAKSVEDLSLRQKAVESKDDPITVIAAAGPALQVAPRVFRNMIMAIILGLFLAAAAALLHDSLDDHINDEEEARWLLDTPILGHLPMLPDADRHLISLEASDARILENFRVLRSNVQFTLMNRTNHALMVTSTIPAEGKTSTASNLAIAMALDGRRIILVDADLHRPQLDGLFGLAKQPGLSNVLVGQAALQDALQATDIPGLRVLTCGVLPPNPAELLNSQAMDELLEAMKADSDMVIFDSPPCLATADAQVLSAKVDGVVYVMELGKVHKSSVQRSFELFHQAQARVLGVVFNKIESSNRDSYTYYDYGYYGDGHGKSTGGDDKAIAGPEKKVLPHRRANGTNGEAAATSNGSSANGDRGHAQVAGDDKQEL
jgi:capsular exopolysaccharide synthesis family protein